MAFLEKPREDNEQELLGFIDELPQKILKAQNSQVASIEAKYHSLLTTMKPLQDLAMKHKKQLQEFVQELQRDFCIDRLSEENDYYKNHVEYLDKLNSNFDRELLKKKQLEVDIVAKVNESRKKLGALKLQNIQLLIAIDKKRNAQQAVAVQKPVVQEVKESKSLLQTDPARAAELELLEAEKQLLEKIAVKVALNEAIWSSFQQVRVDLERHQKIVHGQGLAGSLLFRLTSSHNKQNQVVPKLPQRRRRMDGDLKFLVYDSLKKRCENRKREQAKKNERYEVPLDKFNGYNGLQIMGLMELRQGSLKHLEEELSERRKQLLNKYSQC